MPKPLEFLQKLRRRAIDRDPNRFPPQTTYYNETFNDRWICEYVFPTKRNGYFVEAGAANGQAASSCYVLEKERSWTGICIEPNDFFFAQLVQNRPNSICENVCLSDRPGTVTYIAGQGDPAQPYFSGIQAHLEQYKPGSESVIAAGEAIEKPATTLTELLNKHDAPRTIDYGAFDIEGSEYVVLKNFDFEQYQFLALSLECDYAAWLQIEPLLQSHCYRSIHNPFNLDKPWERYFIHQSLKL
ncbi:FkbM family methyltransferase [Microcoleus sp. FACHB-1515]|uniref:FkbM family methyltransferase n=1 Tax=Cyanophyceae TaxID=3028117 RepID=UPI00168360D7|nr:FkbM family methyltransferase [Microcoleus sp. FACHB-1515]MBD2092216.1 FkbM family methyltransferase [Microcoleus sp. FACHB-1515]